MRNFVAKSNSLMKENAARVRGRVTRTGNKPYRYLSVLKRELALVPRIFFKGISDGIQGILGFN